MGCAIFELCYFQPPRKAIPSQIPGLIIFFFFFIKENNNYYSKQLNDIIKLMIEVKPEKIVELILP